MKTIQEQIEVMQAFADGAEIECKDFDTWEALEKPNWNWMNVDYRIEPKQKTKLWYWEYKSDNGRWFPLWVRLSEEKINERHTTYRKIEALGFIEEEIK